MPKAAAEKAPLAALYLAAARLPSRPETMVVPSLVHTHQLHLRPRGARAISKSLNWPVIALQKIVDRPRIIDTAKLFEG
jgi:hypothetical protein